MCKKILDIFELTEVHPTFMVYYLNTKKIIQASKIMDGKDRVEVGNKRENLRITSSHQKIININK